MGLNINNGLRPMPQAQAQNILQRFKNGVTAVGGVLGYVSGSKAAQTAISQALYVFGKGFISPVSKSGI